MTEPLLLSAVALTSIVAVVCLRRGSGDLGAAAWVVLETVGATVLLFVANLAIAATIVLLARRLWFYPSLYEVTDITLLILSLLQAVTLTAWLRLR